MPIPPDHFAFFNPHPYQALGAPYGGASPWMLRQGVLDALNRANQRLAALRPGWKIMIFDAYRPNAVQAFMVEREFAIQAKLAGLDVDKLTPADRETLGVKVFRLWGIPSADPATPPPHSTGSAVDCTLADEHGVEVDMGSPVDENSDRSNPDYFANIATPAAQTAHANRKLLAEAMEAEGFLRHHAEWWHFSLHDQYWTWRMREAPRAHSDEDLPKTARYGRADLLPRK